MSRATLNFNGPVGNVQHADSITSTTSVYNGSSSSDVKNSSNISKEKRSESKDTKAAESVHDLKGDEFVEMYSKAPPGFYHFMKEGCVYVINNENFNEPSLNRRGSSKDVEALEVFFHQVLRWQLKLKENLPAAKMEEWIMEISEKDFSKYSVLFLVILSHGCSDGIYGTDTKVMKISPVLEYFSADRCPSLANKPKIFIFQACRGSLDDEGFCVTSTDAIPTEASRMIQIPRFSDYLIAYPCIPHYTALRDEKNGTLFIQTLMKYLYEFYDTEHILDIFLRVNFTVSNTTSSLTIKSMPCLDVRLRKKCYFQAFRDSLNDKMKNLKL